MLNAKLHIGRVGAMLFVLSMAVNALADPQRWREQGPGPTLQGQTEGLLNNPVAGAINAIAVSPTDADVVYVGTVNGGIWKTTNATAANPTWTPLTDKRLPALSINSLAISPVRSNTLFAGTGSTSSFGFRGSPGFGVARSNNGGKSWTVLASSTFAGQQINSIVPTALGNGNVVLAATLVVGGGVFRSTDKGESFVQISGGGTGLPIGGVSSLVADPGNSSRFYAGLPTRSFGGEGNAGIYRSSDGGLTWTPVNTGLNKELRGSLRVLLAVHNSTGGNVVYAAIITCDRCNGRDGKLSGVFRSTNQGGSWTSMDVPAPEIFPGGQGDIHGAIVADPTDSNVVFVSGDSQDGSNFPFIPSPIPNANGCHNFTGNTFRGNASLLPGNPWTSVDCKGAKDTSPHADSRAMVFDANGDLLQANDGGIYRLSAPTSAGLLQWSSVIGDIRPTEFHSVAYDPLSNIVLGGAQDTGTTIQSAPGSLTWKEFLMGDGGNVAVDSDQTAHPGTTIRYTSNQYFKPDPNSDRVVSNFNRSTWNATNIRVDRDRFTPVKLNITSGPGTGMTLLDFDPFIRCQGDSPSCYFYQPFVLNAINPSRMLIGTAFMYESMDGGDSLANRGRANRGPTGCCIGNFIGASPIAYGGRLNGVANPDVFYVGAGPLDGVGASPTIRHRVTFGGPITILNGYPGSNALGLVIDPENYQHVFVLDDQSRVWGSFDEGASWVNLTANLPSLTDQVRAIEFVSPDGTVDQKDKEENTVLIVGGLGGVFQRRLRGTEDAEDEDDSWHVLGKGLPHGLVLDLHFNSANNILVGGILGRGAWTFSFKGDDRKDAAVLQRIEGQPTLGDSSRGEAGWAERDGFNLDMPLVPPLAIKKFPDE